MRSGLQPGSKFPNFELPDQTGETHKLSQIPKGFPGMLVFSRGYFCPKDRRQMQNCVDDLQAEMRVGYWNMITVSVDDQLMTQAVRDQLDANWIFLCDTDRRLLYELEMVDRTDEQHGETYIPYTFVLDRDRTIDKVYNGW